MALNLTFYIALRVCVHTSGPESLKLLIDPPPLTSILQCMSTVIVDSGEAQQCYQRVLHFFQNSLDIYVST